MQKKNHNVATGLLQYFFNFRQNKRDKKKTRSLSYTCVLYQHLKKWLFSATWSDINFWCNSHNNNDCLQIINQNQQKKHIKLKARENSFTHDVKKFAYIVVFSLKMCCLINASLLTTQNWIKDQRPPSKTHLHQKQQKNPE